MAEEKTMGKLERVALILVIFAVLGVPMIIFGYQKLVYPVQAAAEGEIPIVINRFEDGGFQPPVIQVKKGQTVRLKLMSHDVTHSFMLMDYHVEVEVKPGPPVYVEFVASDEGSHPFQCNIKCSPLHQSMVGTLVVAP